MRTCFLFFFFRPGGLIRLHFYTILFRLQVTRACVDMNQFQPSSKIMNIYFLFVTQTQQQGPELPNVTLDLANEKTQGKRYTPPELHPQGFGGAYESCIYPHARWEFLRAIRVFAVVYG